MSKHTSPKSENQAGLAAALDHAEFVERVPTLQHDAAKTVLALVGSMMAYDRAYYGDDFHSRQRQRWERRWCDEIDGAYDLCFRLPRHPAVVAYADELAMRNRHRRYSEPDITLKTARRRFLAARLDYENRCHFRCRHDIVGWSDGGAFVSLRAIVEARAEMIFWFQLVMEQEHIAHVKQQNRWTRARARVTSL